ncbi:hypothetical protein V8E36_008400 [Tilletia maclaganii]
MAPSPQSPFATGPSSLSVELPNRPPGPLSSDFHVFSPSVLPTLVLPFFSALLSNIVTLTPRLLVHAEVTLSLSYRNLHIPISCQIISSQAHPDRFRKVASVGGSVCLDLEINVAPVASSLRKAPGSDVSLQADPRLRAEGGTTYVVYAPHQLGRTFHTRISGGQEEGGLLVYGGVLGEGEYISRLCVRWYCAKAGVGGE